MAEQVLRRRWTRHFLHRTERIRATWKLRFAVLIIVCVAGRLTAAWWTVSIGHSLVCDGNVGPSDAIVVENFGPNYLLFEHARELRRAHLANRVLVPIRTEHRGSKADPVALAIAEAMARIAQIGPIDIVLVDEVEPITLNAARDLQRYLEREHITSVIVVTPLFRSRRSALVYSTTLARAGIRVYCQPVEGSRGVNTWPSSWHGIQDVLEQWLKLQYYRMYALPFSDRRISGSAPQMHRHTT